VFLNNESVKADLGAKLMETLIRLLEAMSFWGWMAVIVIGIVAVEGIVKVKRKHAERMSKIEQGIDPGDETEAYKKDEV
jgi:hypothetical protein